MTMGGFLESWYLSGVPAVAAVLLSVWASRQMKSVLARMAGGLRRHDQLPQVRGAIEANMRQAALFVLLYGLLLVALFAGYAKEWITLGSAGLHLLAFGVVTGPFGLWTRQFEKGLQTLDTTGAEPGVAEVYARWLREWKQPRLSLSEP